MPTLPNWTSPLAMAAALAPDHGDGMVRRTPALDLIDRKLWAASRTPGSRTLLSMPPQEGKSTLVARGFPLWRLWQNRSLRIVIVSYEVTLARQHSAAIRDQLTTHVDQLGFTVKTDTRAKGEWKVSGGPAGREGGVYAVGIGGPLTGRPADLMIIDDPIKGRAEAESPAYRQAMKDWWTGTGSSRLAADAQVIVIQTRWHEDDMIGYLIGQEDGDRWDYLNIPAVADHDPAKGETDVLGREPGEFMISAQGRTRQEWKQRQVTAGSRDWNALYQGRPSALEGDLLKRNLWQTYSAPLWVDHDGTRWLPYDDDQEVLISVDCAFKDSETSDYVAVQVWMRRGPNAYLLDQRHGHFDFTETVKQVRAMAGRWPQATIKLIEEAANGAAVIATLRANVSGVIGEIPQGSKFARAAAITPFLEAGNVWLPDPLIEGCAWVTDFIEEAAAFPNGAHDDRVDSATQAINRLLMQPFIADTVEDDPEQALIDERGYSLSPY